jgi:predicted nucleic acid-binding protein
MKNIILDTNILIYADDIESPNHEICNRLIESTKYKFYVTESILFEYYRVLTTCNSKFKNIETTEVIESIEIFSQNFTVLKSTNDTLNLVLEICKTNDIRSGAIFDVNIFALSIENEIDIICTYNIKDYIQNSTIKIFNPEDIIEQISFKSN